MRRKGLLIGAIASLVFGLVPPTFASGYGTIQNISSNGIAVPALGSGTKPYLYVDYATGQTSKFNPTTKLFESFAPAAPDYPSDYIFGSSSTVLREDGALVFVVAMQEPDYSHHHVYKNVFVNGSWGTWQLLLDSTNIMTKLYVDGYGVYGGHDVLLYRRVSGDSSVTQYTIGTNASGSWQELLISTNRSIDHLGGLLLPGQNSQNDGEILYSPNTVNYSQILNIVNGKVGLLGQIQAHTSNFVVNGHTFTDKFQHFTQIISLNPLQSVKRTMLGAPVPVSYSEVQDEHDGAVNYGSAYPHWNAAGTDLVVVATRSLPSACPAVPLGRDPDAFEAGHCSQTLQVVQYHGANVTVLASKSFRFGESGTVGLSEVKTASGWYSTTSFLYRDMEVDVNGDFVGPLDGSGKFGWKLNKGDSNGYYTPAEIVTTSSSSHGQGTYVWINVFKGIPAVVAAKCLTAEAYNCTREVTYFSEGKTQTDYTPYQSFENENSWQDLYLSSTGDDWIVERVGWDYTTNPYTSFQAVISGGYAPIVTKLNQSFSAVSSSVKRGKTLALPLTSKQTHTLTWSVASKSKKICSITTTRKSGVITKLTLKGLRSGTCTLTAKASAGFFYKALSKTVTVKVK
ncbi:MAG: hypothetical protein RL410_35 [Actinomycetota bacterium]